MYKKGVPPYMAMIFLEATSLGYYQAETEEQKSAILDVAIEKVMNVLNVLNK